MNIVELVVQKNKLLRKFRDLTVHFINTPLDPQLVQLIHLQNKRDSVIKACEIVDDQINRKLKEIEKLKLSESDRLHLKSEFEEKERIVQEIKVLDEKVIQMIREEQDKVSLEMTKTKEKTSKMNKFKSKNEKDRGRELDQQV
ncbi:MAG: hypothetical protein CL678_14350 [Bdellovibrionaceae bacterium]|nr:hypothetical protein [Pseudobdellovibrionaceae bacterium]|tara:strand:- start:703 stop:1131 length:429 start_codon:yes stop_codon:yes gene_type:complete